MDDFARRLLGWFDHSGRKDLPWQQAPDPYRVWVSEIMLQQTQVVTVIPYYQRFMARFPDCAALAAAGEEEVLAHWSGLGYYSRARNLHRAARMIREEYGGEFPHTLEALMALPGIGRSTAGAILSLALGQRHPILDGNVKRVLSRFHALAGWPGKRAVELQLWQHAEAHTPPRHCAEYTQAIMDLGATVCTRKRPRCEACPVNADCQAYLRGGQENFPEPRPRKTLPRRKTVMLVIRNGAGEVLLQKRPPAGIWGGLWSFPECPDSDTVAACCSDKLGIRFDRGQRGKMLRHSFSHFHLEILPLYIQLDGGEAGKVMEPDGAVWYNSGSFHKLGLPAPVRQLLAHIDTEFEEKTV